MRWTSTGDPKFCVAYDFDFVNLQVSIFVRCVLVMVSKICVAYYFNFVNCKFQYSYDVYLLWFKPQIFANLHNSIVGHVVVAYYIA